MPESPEYVLAVDLGTSGPKVALFTPAGEYVDGEFEPVELQLSAGGGAQHLLGSDPLLVVG